MNFLKKTSPSSSSRKSKFSSEKYIYLTTRGRRSGLPREIEIWFTEFQDHFYVIAEHSSSQWVRNLRADPQVKIRIGGRQFPAKACILSKEAQAALVTEIQSLSERKYGWGDGLVVEIVPTVQISSE